MLNLKCVIPVLCVTNEREESVVKTLCFWLSSLSLENAET